MTARVLLQWNACTCFVNSNKHVWARKQNTQLD